MSKRRPGRHIGPHSTLASELRLYAQALVWLIPRPRVFTVRNRPELWFCGLDGKITQLDATELRP